MAKVRKADAVSIKKDSYEEIWSGIFYWLTSAYILIVLAVLPLYTPDAYYSIGDNKWKIWIYATTAFVAIMFITYLVRVVLNVMRDKSGISNSKKSYLDSETYTQKIINQIKGAFWPLSIVDWFVLAYLLVVLVSSALSPFKSVIWIGAEGWNMGLWSQLGFIIGYFIISRCWKYSTSIMRWALVASGFIYYFGTVMRFGRDPLGFYNGLTEWDKLNYISTLGQTSWYSSFLCLILPIAIIGYCVTKSTVGRIFNAIIACLGFMSTVTQNSDSAYLAFVGYMFVLFWVCSKERVRFGRFLEVLIMCFGCFKFIGILQIAMPDKATQLDKISTTMSQGNITWLALGVSIVLYVIYRLTVGKASNIVTSTETTEETKAPRDKFLFALCILRWVFLVLAILGIIAGVTYIVLNTKGKLPESLASDNNYLFFNMSWGNHRGISWTAAVYTFISEHFGRKLIGWGPDTYGSAVYTYYSDQINNYFIQTTGDQYVVLCAHNEWLNTLVIYGLLGFVAYLGIYVSCFGRCMSRAVKEDKPELYGIALAIVAYFAHNLFCYQQVICTSVIFVLIGIAEAMVRNGRVGAAIDEAKTDSKPKNKSGKKATFGEIVKMFMSA